MIKDIFLNWNIPWINIFSKLVIIFWLIWIPILWYFWLNNFGLQFLLWDISWWSVVFVIWIRPLSNLFPKIKVLKRLLLLRKAFWILSASIVVSALVYKFIWNPKYLYTYFSINNWKLYYPLFWRLTEITWIILLITSNRFSQKNLWIWWKKIQRLSYVYFISWWIVAAMYTPLKIYLAMWIVIFLWILALIKTKKTT